MGECAFALCKVGDVGLIETAHKFAVNQSRRLPVGIAVRDAVAQIVRIVVNQVEVHIQLLIAAQSDDGHSVGFIDGRNFQRMNVLVEDAYIGVHSLCKSGNCQNKANGYGIEADEHRLWFLKWFIMPKSGWRHLWC